MKATFFPCQTCIGEQWILSDFISITKNACQGQRFFFLKVLCCNVKLWNYLFFWVLFSSCGTHNALIPFGSCLPQYGFELNGMENPSREHIVNNKNIHLFLRCLIGIHIIWISLPSEISSYYIGLILIPQYR